MCDVDKGVQISGQTPVDSTGASLVERVARWVMIPTDRDVPFRRSSSGGVSEMG